MTIEFHQQVPSKTLTLCYKVNEYFKIKCVRYLCDRLFIKMTVFLPKCRPVYRCDFVIPPHQGMKSFSLLPYLESGLGLVIFFGQWNINKKITPGKP